MKGFIEVHKIAHDRWEELHPEPIRIAVRHIRTYEECSYVLEEDRYKDHKSSYGTIIKLYNAEYKVKEPVWEVERLIEEAQHE